MANVDRPKGLVPIGTLDGSPYNAAIREYPVDASNGTAIFIGDAITLEDDGNVTPAAAGGIILGVCVGIKVTGESGTVDNHGNFLSTGNLSTTEHPGYLAATTAGRILVAVGPDILYEIQEDSVGGAMVITNIGTNGNLVAGAGSTTTGISAHELDSSDVITNDASAATAQLRVVDFVRRPDNEIGANAKWVVRINEPHWIQDDTAKIGL